MINEISQAATYLTRSRKSSKAEEVTSSPAIPAENAGLKANDIVYISEQKPEKGELENKALISVNDQKNNVEAEDNSKGSMGLNDSQIYGDSDDEIDNAEGRYFGRVDSAVFAYSRSDSEIGKVINKLV